MKGWLKKEGKKMFFTKKNKIVILGIACCILLGGLSPTIYNTTVNDPISGPEQNNDESNNNDAEYKQTGYGNYTYVSFYWSPRYPDEGEAVTFYSSNYDLRGHLSSFRWNFGDGSSGYGYIASHIYDKKGSYGVTLSYTAWDSEEGYIWGSGTNSVHVGEDPFPRLAYSPKNPSPGEQVNLDGSASSDPDGQITSYVWSYYSINDPSNITEIGYTEDIKYSWEEQGIYNVRLQVSDDKGNNNTLEETISVSILKLGGFPKRERGLSFEISNHGTFKAKNIEWSVEINKYSLFGIRSQNLYSENGTSTDIGAGNNQQIYLSQIPRKFSKVKIIVTVKAENAVEISESYYGLMFGKTIFISENNFVNPYNIVIGAGIIIAGIIYYVIQNYEPSETT